MAAKRLQIPPTPREPEMQNRKSRILFSSQIRNPKSEIRNRLMGNRRRPACAAILLASLSIASLASSQITVTSPNGSERLVVGTTHTITWTAPLDITQVKIEYSSNAGTTWTTFTNNTLNDGSETWTVPNIPSAFCMIRVSDTVNVLVSDTSDGMFRVEPAGSWPFIVTKTSGEVILSYLVGGSAAANSEIGFGYATATTPASYRHILYQDVPNNPLATPDHSLGFLPAGSGLDFYVITLGQSAYSGNRPNESFSDTDNNNGLGDTAVTVLPNEAEGYLMHLDRCTGGSDDDNDFLIEVRVVAMTESPPVAVVQTPSGVQTGLVTVIYMLKDTQGDPCTIVVQFSEDAGLTWQPATQGPGGDGTYNLTSSRTGQKHVFVWDSLADIGQTRQSDIRIRITPADPEIGTSGETSNFTVDNVPPPVLSSSPDSFVFDAMEHGSDPPVSILTIWNSGGGTLSWQVADTAPWLTLTPVTGQSAGEEDSVEVAVSAAGLIPGTYDATITISSTQLPGESILVPVTLTVVEMVPILSVSPSAMSFSGYQGGPNPAPQSLEIQNIGGNPMTWQVTSSLPWLTLWPDSGSSEGEVDPVEVSVDLTGLTIGDYHARVIVTASADNSPKEIPVLLTVTEPPPILSVSPQILTFSATEEGASPLPQEIQIRNVGTGEFLYDISDDTDWLSALPTTGTNAGETDGVMVQADITGLPAGTYNAALTVTADAERSPQNVNVTLTVLPKPPALSVSPTLLHFEAVEGKADPAPQTVTVKNVGSGDMDWHASADMPWLNLSPQDGSSSGEGDDVDVSVAVTGLEAGSYTGRVTLTSLAAANSPVEVFVSLDVAEPPPRLVISPASLTFTCVEGEENPSPQEIEVGNAGGGQLEWQAALGATWISLSPTSGSLSAGSVEMVQAEVDASGLIASIYTATVTLTGTGESTPQTVLVTLIVEQPPPASLEVSPLALEFHTKEGDGNPSSQEITIRNAGGRELAWHVFSDSGWLRCSPDSGTSRGEADIVTVSVEVLGLDPGVHSATLTVTAPGAENSPQRIQVTFTLEALKRVLEVSPTRLDFERDEGSADPPPQTLSVRNVGEGDMSWQVSADEPWVSLSPQFGTNTGGADFVQVSIESQSLPLGTYTASVTVRAEGAENSPQSISVGLVIKQNAPVLEVSPSALSFEMDEEGDAPDSKTFAIRNTGGRTMDWQVSADQQWVTLSPASGVNSGVAQFVHVSISARGMAAGNYTSAVTVNAPGSVNSPQTISIRLTIKTVIPEIRLTPQLLEFKTRRGGANPADLQFSIVVISSKAVAWVAAEGADWLSLTPSTGTNSGESDTVTVSVNKSALSLGTYETDIVVRDAQKPTFTASLHVILRVEPIRVPADYPSIREAIAASQQRDVIAVSAGTYREKIQMKDGIEVVGEGADTTTIDCGKQGTTVVFEGLNWATLEGFTVTRGNGERFGKGAEVGGGIFVRNASALISRCRIVNNSAVWGGGVCLDEGAFPEFVDCEVSGNSAAIGGGFFCYEGATGAISTSSLSGNIAEWYGGAVCLTKGSSMILAGCLITGNTASYDSAGISGTAESDVSLISCTIADNEAPEGAALFMESSSLLKAENSIVWANTSPMILEGTHSFRNCDLEDSGLAGQNGNISADPRFAEPAKGDYHLLPSSPCLDTGWNEATGLPQFDIDGEERVMEGPLGMVTDMGADELNADLPIALVDGVSAGENGWFEVSYTLYHLWDIPCSVTVEYSKNSGQNWKRATRATAGDKTFELSTSPEGETYMFFWDSIADEGGVDVQSVLVRVTATAGDGGQGAAMKGGVAGPFALRNSAADKDNDRLPDFYEQRIADADVNDDILSPAEVFPDDDFDGDGSSNRMEYLLGTDPADAGSSLRLLCARGIDSETILSWTSVEGKVYRLLYTEGLQNGWRILTQPVLGTGDWLEYRDNAAATEAHRFYRLEAE